MLFCLTFLGDSDLQLAAKPGSSESLQQLIEIARNPGVNAAALTSPALGKEDKTRQSRDKVSGDCMVYTSLPFVLCLILELHTFFFFWKQPSNQLIASREEYSNIEPVEPDGFHEQVSGAQIV